MFENLTGGVLLPSFKYSVFGVLNNYFDHYGHWFLVGLLWGNVFMVEQHVGGKRQEIRFFFPLLADILMYELDEVSE